MSDCRVLHETAELEIAFYKKIVSPSVATHMEECKINYRAIQKQPATRPDNCLHEFDTLSIRLDGHATLACTRCGTTKSDGPAILEK